MSTRYVWSRNAVNYEIQTRQISLSGIINTYQPSPILQSRFNDAICLDKPTLNGNRLEFPSTGTSIRENSRGQIVLSDTTKCYQVRYFVEDGSESQVAGAVYHVPASLSSGTGTDPSNDDGFFYINETTTVTASTGNGQVIVTANPSNVMLPYVATIKGAPASNVSNASSGAYQLDTSVDSLL